MGPKDLVKSHMSMASRIARIYIGRGEEFDDLNQVAMLALVNASCKFDATRGHTFAQYAYPCIVGGLKKHFRDNAWQLHVSRRVQELYLLTHRATPELTQRLGRVPSMADLAKHLGLSEQDIRDGVEGRLAYRTQSLSQPTNEGEEGVVGRMVGGVDERLESTADRLTMRTYIKVLPIREQNILHLRFSDGLNQRQIGERLGISQMHVSRLLSQSIDTLRVRITAAA